MESHKRKHEEWTISLRRPFSCDEPIKKTERTKKGSVCRFLMLPFIKCGILEERAE